MLKPAGHAGFLEQNEQFAKALKTFSDVTSAMSVELFAHRERDQRLGTVDIGHGEYPSVLEDMNDDKADRQTGW